MTKGGSISSRPLVFSADGKLLIVASGRVIKLFSTSTGELVNTLAGHHAEVTCINENPDDTSQVYSGSEDGTIRLWDYHNQECLKVYKVREVIRYMAITRGTRIAYLAITWTEALSGRVLAYDLDAGKVSPTAMKTHDPGAIVLSPGGTYAASIDRNSLFVWRTGKDLSQPVNFPHTKKYTCLSFGADDDTLVAGDKTGRILVWRGIGAVVPQGRPTPGKARPPLPQPLTTLHWHAQAVGCVGVSVDGSRLISGGGEGTLVLWSLDNPAQRTYLPRLGGGLVGVHTSPADPALLAVRQRDNVIRIVNTATMKVESSIIGLRPEPLQPRWTAQRQITPSPQLPANPKNPSVVALQPGTGHLLVACEGAELQLYNAVADTHVALLQVAPRNQIRSAPPSGHPSLAPPPEPRVVLTAFSHDAAHLVTVDVRADASQGTSTESTLKFWDAGATGGPSYLLNTRVDDPHRGDISSLAFHPSLPLAVTSGTHDAEFRIWERSSGKPRSGARQSCWCCRAVGSYKGLRVSSSAFSPDGSVLALGVGTGRVVLCDAMTGAPAIALLAALGAGGSAAVSMLTFVPGTKYLAGASAMSLVVWDVALASVVWSQALQVCALVADPNPAHGTFVVASVREHARSCASGALPPSAVPGVDREKVGNGVAAKTGPSEVQKPKDVRHEEETPLNSDSKPNTSKRDKTAAQAGQQQHHATGAFGGLPGVQEGAGSLNTTPKGAHDVIVQAFHPYRAQPVMHAQIQNSKRASLAFVTPSMTPYPELTQHCPEGLSPLLLVLEDRRLAFCTSDAALASLQSADPVKKGLSAAESAVGKDLSLFEAAFGNPRVATKPARWDTNMLDVNVGVERSLREMFDAPSHLLAPPSKLAMSFLQLLNSEDLNST